MAVDSRGAKNQPQFDGTKASNTAADDNAIADYAALVGNRKAGTAAARAALTGSDVWEGLEFHETDTTWTYRYLSGGWKLWEVPRTTFTPAWASGFSVGNGTQTARWSLAAGYVLDIMGNAVLGSTSAVTGAIVLTVPAGLSIDTIGGGHRFPVGQMGIYNHSADNDYFGICTISSSTGIAMRPMDTTQPYAQVNTESPTVPMAWNTLDQFSYQIRVYV